MSTTTRNGKWMQAARTMLLGLVLALGIAVVGGHPQAAWLGFAVAAMYDQPARRRPCLARAPRRPRG
jgi:hypothetical protein